MGFMTSSILFIAILYQLYIVAYLENFDYYSWKLRVFEYVRLFEELSKLGVEGDFTRQCQINSGATRPDYPELSQKGTFMQIIKYFKFSKFIEWSKVIKARSANILKF